MPRGRIRYHNLYIHFKIGLAKDPRSICKHKVHFDGKCVYIYSKKDKRSASKLVLFALKGVTLISVFEKGQKIVSKTHCFRYTM